MLPLYERDPRNLPPAPLTRRSAFAAQLLCSLVAWGATIAVLNVAAIALGYMLALAFLAVEGL